MKHNSGCMICGSDLVYTDELNYSQCSLCGKTVKSNAKCRNGHFVCDECHGVDAIDIIENICSSSPKTDPLELAMDLMQEPYVNLHGPEHHYLIPAVLITSYCNQFETDSDKRKKLALAKERASKVPGGYCGFYGSCGAGVGCGIFASVITGATPLTKDSWGFSNKMTGYVLSSLGEIGGPRCCKRNGFNSIIKASEFLFDETGKQLFDYKNARPVCTYKDKNKECIKMDCPFFLNK